MGTSFVGFHQKGFWVRDSGLEVWLHFLATEIDRLPSPSQWQRQVRDHWYQQAQSGAVGCLWAGLDDFVTTTEQGMAVIQLCEAALRTLASYGDVIPQEYLNAIASDGSEWSHDIAVDFFARVGRAFIELLRGEMTTDAATSPVIYYLMVWPQLPPNRPLELTPLRGLKIGAFLRVSSTRTAFRSIGGGAAKWQLVRWRPSEPMQVKHALRCVAVQPY